MCEPLLVIAQQPAFDLPAVENEFGVDWDDGLFTDCRLLRRHHRPEWAAVTTGWFASQVSLVPLAAADFDGYELTVPYGKEQVQQAPHHDPLHAEHPVVGKEPRPIRRGRRLAVPREPLPLSR